VLGCTTPKDEDSAAANEQSCASSVKLKFPGGGWAAYEGCNDVLVDATFEFDPDDPPEIRSFRMQLAGAVDPGFDCWLIVTSSGLCGPGYYDVGTGFNTQVEYQVQDCPNVADDFEAAYTATEGILLIEEASAGDEPGNFADTPLLTRLRGAIEASPESGVSVEVSFDVRVNIRGSDAAEIECDKAD